MKKLFLMSLVAVTPLFTACKKQGCTDELADNFDAEAEAEDGSCSYSTDLIFYLNDTRKDYWDSKSDFFAPFHLYINDAKIGELSVSASSFQTYSTPPTCETTTGGILKYDHMMDSKLGTVSVSIKDQLGNSHGSINVSTAAGECNAVLL